MVFFLESRSTVVLEASFCCKPGQLADQSPVRSNWALSPVLFEEVCVQQWITKCQGRLLQFFLKLNWAAYFRVSETFTLGIIGSHRYLLSHVCLCIFLLLKDLDLDLDLEFVWAFGFRVGFWENINPKWSKNLFF